MKVRVANLQGMGAREYQEDSFAIVNSINLFERRKRGLFAVVCDGMGGLVSGKQVSQYATGAMVQAFQNLDFNQPMGHQLAQSANQISETICGEYAGDGGTTMVAVRIFENRMDFVSVGDSIILLKRGEFLIQLNQEHIQFNQCLADEMEQETICIEAAYQEVGADRLTSYVGMGQLSEIDFTVNGLPLQPHDKIMLCSDGVSKVLSEGQLLEALALPAEQAARNIESEILKMNRQYQDNFTAIIIQIKE